jgi:hypothetical protein
MDDSMHIYNTRITRGLNFLAVLFLRYLDKCWMTRCLYLVKLLQEAISKHKTRQAIQPDTPNKRCQKYNNSASYHYDDMMAWPIISLSCCCDEHHNVARTNCMYAYGVVLKLDEDIIAGCWIVKKTTSFPIAAMGISARTRTSKMALFL